VVIETVAGVEAIIPQPTACRLRSISDPASLDSLRDSKIDSEENFAHCTSHLRDGCEILT